MKLCVIIATHGRIAIVERLLGHLSLQTRPADAVVLAVPLGAAAEGTAPGFAQVEVVRSELGSCAQRNAGLEAAKDRFDILIFLDDDFVPHDTFLETVEHLMEQNPDWAVLTGTVILDGVRGEGYSYDVALDTLRAAALPAEAAPEPTLGAYGCNMIVRSSMIGDTRFDTNLPLYGWQEDIDFSVQLSCRGKVIRAKNLLGVHLGTKKARSPGRRLGYSQVANPVYLVRKGTMPFAFARKLVVQNIGGNLVHALNPEPYVDRRGRLAGNMLAIADLVRGRLHPTKILSFD
jgi:GT2 family glycosyltransferase